MDQSPSASPGFENDAAVFSVERDDESPSCCQEGEGHGDTFSDEVIGPFHSIEEMFVSREEDW